MTTQYSERAPRLQLDATRNESPYARDVSIADFSWAAQRKIFGQYVFVQTSTSQKGASSPHVC